MKITDVRIRRVPGNDGKLKAFCSLVFDGMLAVDDFRIIDGVHGLFVAMPCRKYNDKYHETVRPVSAEARSLIQRVVLAAYRSVEEPQLEPATTGLEATLPEELPREQAEAEMEAMPA